MTRWQAVLRTAGLIGAIVASSLSSAAGATVPSTSALAGTSWQLVKFRGGDDSLLTPDDRTKYTFEFGADGTVAARIDCNRGRATWTSSDTSGLTLGPLALTRAMCPPGSLHDRIVKDWGAVRSFVIKDGHLFLSLMADGGIYELEPAAAAATGGAAVAKPAAPSPPVSAPGDGHLKGTVAFRERVALPPDAVLEVVLEDDSRAGAPADVIGRALFEGPGNPPISFVIDYEPARIDPKHRYAVRARISVGDKPWFVTDRSYPVLSAGKSQDLAVLLKRPGGAGPAEKKDTAPFALPLEKTYWKLASLGDPPAPVGAAKIEAHLTLDPVSRLVNGSGGCNRVTGTYSLQSEHLELSDMAATMMACTDGMATEKAFLEALPRTRSWRIKERRLELLDADGKILAGFEGR